MGTGTYSQRVKRSLRVVYHLSASVVEVKIEWSYVSADGLVRERARVEIAGLDARIILNWILRKQDGRR